MATLYTDVATKQDSPLPANRVAGNKITGENRYIEAVYTTTGAEAASDIIDVTDIPIGAVVIPELSRVACEASGGTGTAISKIGDASDDDRYSATSIALTSAATTAVTPAVATSVTLRTPVTSTTKRIKATVALSSGSVTAGKKVVFTIAYRLP